MGVFAYIARRYNSAAESTSLLSSVASLAINPPIVYYDGIKIRWLTEASINDRTISFIEEREIWSSFFKS